MRNRTIPFFIPFAGCPCRCCFCSQSKITGVYDCEKELSVELAELERLIEASKKTVPVGASLAFFGGSFTAIDRNRMLALLEEAHRYIESGFLSGIRISTRPDCLSREILDILHKYGVKSIELGIQSVSDRVLAASERGCTASQAIEGMRLIASDGRFVLGGQMMIGLPESDMRTELETAKAIVAAGAKEARIYPTVVFGGTRLYDMTLAGQYHPLSNDSAIIRSAACARIFIDAGITLLKMGLHSGSELANAPYGANDQSIGEQIYAEVYRQKLTELMSDMDVRGKSVVITVPRGEISKLTGHGGKVKNALCNKFGLLSVSVKEADLPYMTADVKVKE